MFLINLILSGVANGATKTSKSLVTAVLSNFLSSPTETDHHIFDTNNNAISTTNRNRLIITTCLTLEVISITSRCLAPADFNLFLIDTLYFGLENYLSSVLLIRVVAQKCLQNLAVNLEYSSIQSLLSTNYDYIMNDLVLKSHNQISLEQTTETKSAHVYVLCSLLDIANCDLVPYLERLIDDYFLMIELNSQDFTKILGICEVWK